MQIEQDAPLLVEVAELILTLAGLIFVGVLAGAGLAMYGIWIIGA